MILEEQVGSRLVFGIPGTTITPEIIRHFQETHAGGLILYRINFESPDQLRKLISDLEQALGRRLLVCTDHEGGRVIMFGDGVTVFPSSQAFAATGQTQLVRRQGEQEARELRRLGIDVNFAPVLDVLTDTYSPNIGIRSYGKDADVVAKMGAARISALQVENVSACAKHFPGLGPATLDPHLTLPSIAMTWEELENVHMVPFYRAMRTAVQSIMTSHPLYPQLDPTPKTPATFSRKIVYDYLRKKVGYKGVIFSDDLEMGAITEICPIGEAAVRTVEAGHDMVLACHDMKAQRAVYDALLEAYQSKRLATAEMDESLLRIENLKGKRTERFAPLPATEARVAREREEVETLLSEIAALSVSTLRPGPSLEKSASTAVIFPRLSELASKIMIEKELLDEKSFLEQRLKAFGLTPAVSLVPVDPNDSDVRTASSAMAGAEQILLFVYDAHMYAGWKAILDSAQTTGKRLTVVLLRDVYDAESVHANVLCVTNYGFRKTDLDAVFKKLFAPSAVVSSGVPQAS